MRRCLCALLLSCGPWVWGDVFLRRPADIPSSWERAYHTDIAFQNSKGELELFRSWDSVDLIRIALQNQHGDQLAFVAGEIMGWGLVIEKGSLIRYLVQPLPEGGSWIVRIKEPLRRAGKPGDLPHRHQLDDLPIYPQSIPTFYSHDQGNQVSVEISECNASPAEALNALSQMVEAAGWTPSPINTGGFQVFVKGEKVAFLGAQRGKDGRTRILRLHKPLGVK
ncbi:hypothetical protein P3T73_15930 [Kiritimatiellota bacterium B12222]|nr:hypothetical protein P3T73_15930 [Kiritimatiellota bacterium B12222]